MRRFSFTILNVFAETHFGGNQLAVVPDAEGLSDGEMQTLARQFNLPETTFVLPPGDSRHVARVRIFTPAVELPFAGHPTVGTAVALARLKHGPGDFVLEEKVGPVPVSVRFDNDASFAEFTLAGHIECPDITPDPSLLGATLSLPASTIIDGWFGSAGVPICFVQLTSPEAVDQAALNRAAWGDLTDWWSRNLYIFSGQPGVERLHARFFAPALGVDEDPATGAAAAALAGSWAKRRFGGSGRVEMTIDQGIAMGRPSVIVARAEADGGQPWRVSVGGRAIFVAEGTISVPASTGEGIDPLKAR
jgi:trans-2,3-dihydro-3-hydroxyanthranilate isomerase